jgi:hypothetical protein
MCMFGGVLLGACLRPLLPGHHVSADSRDVVKLGVGVIATQAALVLGLLVSSAKGAFDTMNAEITQASARMPRPTLCPRGTQSAQTPSITATYRDR